MKTFGNLIKNNTLTRVGIFYLLALLSNIFRKGLFGLTDLVKNLPDWIKIIYGIIGAIGILAGAMVTLHLMRKKKKTQYSFFGTSKLFSILIALIPFILVIVFGFKNNSGINPHLFAVLPAISVLVYSYFEEIGWRGYLHDELQGIKQWQRVIIIGFLWWFWHLQFIGDYNLISNLTFLIILTSSAFGLGILIENTKSVLTASAFHMVVNILFLNPAFKKYMPINRRLLILGISIVLWIVILIVWERKNKTSRYDKSTMNNTQYSQ